MAEQGEVIGHANPTGLIRMPRHETTPFGNPNPEGGCTGDPFCQIWKHVGVYRLDGGKVALRHLELEGKPRAVDGSD